MSVILNNKGNHMVNYKTILWTLLLLIFSGASYADKKAENYANTIKIFKDSPVGAEFFKTAYGYAVFPTVGKGGVGIGGAFGEGRVYKKDTVTGTVSLAQLTIGLQLGGQAFSQIVFLKDERAYKEFTGGSFEFDAQASAIAITAGAQAQAGTSGKTAGASAGVATGKEAAKYTKGMGILVRGKGGLMYEVSLGGQKFTFKPL